MPLYVRTVLATGPPDEVAEASRGHRRHLSSLESRGVLRAAGEFRDADGFLDIFEARDLKEAEAIARSSPLIDAGLATWMLREWRELDLEA